MRNGIRTGRQRTLAVLLSVLVLMSLACSLTPSFSSVPSAAHASTTHVGGSPSPSADSEEPHPCGVPQSQPSTAPHSLLGALPLSPLLAPFDPPRERAGAAQADESPGARHGNALLTFLCVQRV